MKASLTVKLIHSCKTNGALLHRKIILKIQLGENKEVTVLI